MNALLILFIVFAGGFVINHLFFGHAPSESTTDPNDEWLVECYEPKQPSRFKIWLCKQRDHNGQALHFIENNQGTKKIKCLGCGTVFLDDETIIMELR